MPPNSKGVGCRREDNERADQIRERRLAAQLNCSERGTQYCCQDGGWDRATQAFVDLGEERRERGGVVAGQSPEYAADGQVGSQHAYHDGEEDDEEEAEGGAFA